jgi:hypothetical protein
MPDYAARLNIKIRVFTEPGGLWIMRAEFGRPECCQALGTGFSDH